MAMARSPLRRRERADLARYLLPAVDARGGLGLQRRDALASGEGVSVTLKEAAALLGVTPDNLRGAIARGSLKAEKHGRDWWVQPAEVKRYGAENRR